MINSLQKKVKKKNVNLNNIDSNFIKVNSVMNQRLIGLIDYLKASVYFSRYNDKKTTKNRRNLEKFFKNEIFQTNPFSIPSLKHSFNSNLSEKKNKNGPLDIIVNLKNNKLLFHKNKYTSPYDLNSKKQNFLKNMVFFSKELHSELKVEKDLMKKYPKIESFPLNTNYRCMKKNGPITPNISRGNLSIKTDRLTCIYNDKKNQNSFFKNNYKKAKNRIKNAKTYLSLDKIEKFRNDFDITNNIHKNKNNLYNSHLQKSYSKNRKSVKLFRANCYYNKLHLKKLSKNLIKFTYLNKKDD